MNYPQVFIHNGHGGADAEDRLPPLLDSGIEGFSPEDMVAEDCGYVRLPEGGWGLVTAQYSRKPRWQGGLANATALPRNIIKKDFRASERNPA